MCVVGAFLAVGVLTAVLFLFGIRPYVVVTGSMEPVVHLGSICFIVHKAAAVLIFALKRRGWIFLAFFYLDKSPLTKMTMIRTGNTN